MTIEPILANVSVLEADVLQPVQRKLIPVGQVQPVPFTHLAALKRCSWYSKLCTRPRSPTARDNECVMLPLPVPASNTVLPGRTPRRWMMKEMSGR